MTTRAAMIVGGSLVLGGLAAGVWWGPSLQAQQPAVPSIPEARFQMATVGTPNVTYVIVFDSTTGQCWSQQPGTNFGWQDLGTPAPRKR